jgi:NUDIX domain-containing protein
MKHAWLTGCALRGAHQIQKAYWKLFRPMTLGVRVLLVKESSVVLVQHSYMDGWFLPGGGVKKGERFEAAIREHGYFGLEKLPDGTSPGTRKRIEEFLDEAWVKVGDW